MTRRLMLRRAALAILGGGVIAAGGAGLAWGYWLASDSSNPASAKADSLQQGATPSVSVTDATSVGVSWSAASTVGGHAATVYVVNRYPSASGGSPTPAGGTCAGTVTALNCSDTGVYGDWYYTVTPKIGLWVGTESARSLVAAAASKLVLTSTALTGTASSSAALGPISVQIRSSADSNLNAPAGGLSVGLASSSPGAKFAASSGGAATSAITVPAGSSTGSFYYGDTVAGTPRITVSAANLTSATQNETITPASAASLVVSGFPSPQTAGVPGSFIVSATDAFGNTATGYRGRAHFTSTDSQAVLPADYTFAAADNGTHTFSATLKTAGSRSITATDTVTSSITGLQSGITVDPAAASTLIVSGFPSPQTAGAAGSLNVLAKDPFGNVATGYRGTVHVTSSDPQASLPADYAFTSADSGAHTFNATLKTTGSRSITATDTSNSSVTGAQTGIAVTPATAASFTVSGFPSAQTAGLAGSFTVTTKDAFGNTATGYVGTVRFTSSDAQALVPANYTFVAGDNGVHTFSATLKTAGQQSITAADTVTSSITGSQSGITVNPAVASTLVVSGFPSPQTAGVAGSVTVTAKDTFGNTATSYAGTVRFTSSDAQAVLPANYTFVSGDSGVHTFSATLKTAATQSMTATDTVTSSIAGSQAGITVTAASPSKLCFVATLPSACSGGSVTIAKNSPYQSSVRLQDAFGNTASATSAITVTMGFSPTGGTGIGFTSSSITISAGTSDASFTFNPASGKNDTRTLTASANGLTQGSLTTTTS